MRELKQIANSNDGLFRKAMEIYLHAFPANERQAVETIEARVNNGLYLLYTACANNEVLAMMLLYPLGHTEFIVIDYLAVNSGHRKKGIGAWLLREAMADVKHRYEDKIAVLEAEDPEYGDNREERLARVNFYKKLGARTMEGVHYMLPPLAGDIPTEMVLMLLPGYNDDSVRGIKIKNLIVQMYRQLYGREVHDELLRTFIEQVPRVVRLV
jgi:ribosomal protein S18 acetylase RimI-like enzyme